MRISKYKIILNRIFNTTNINFSCKIKFSSYKNLMTMTKSSSRFPFTFINSNSIIKEIKSIHILDYFIFRFNKTKRNIFISTISTVSFWKSSIDFAISSKSTIKFINFIDCIITTNSKWHFSNKFTLLNNPIKTCFFHYFLCSITISYIFAKTMTPRQSICSISSHNLKITINLNITFITNYINYRCYFII